MIQPQELRIGDYVDVFDKIDEIKSINENEHGGFCKFKNNPYQYYLSHDGDALIKPIPLTEEILLKFGFIRNQIKTISEVIDVSGNDKLLEFEVTEMGLDLWISSDKIDEALYFPVNYIKYAHNLQNLFFSLCGEELSF